MPNITTLIEAPRGCGYRKEGGFYLMLPKFDAKPCGKLPLPLEQCPCCSQGIKFSRGWTWINGKLLFENVDCKNYLDGDDSPCGSCILSSPPEKMGLIWIGEKYYRTPEDWIDEGITMGISRRIKNIPKGFIVGETWVAVAHIKAIPATIKVFGIDEIPARPAIFQVFKPSHVDYVVKSDDTEEHLSKLEEKGVRLVNVVKKEKAMVISNSKQQVDLWDEVMMR